MALVTGGYEEQGTIVPHILEKCNPRAYKHLRFLRMFFSLECALILTYHSLQEHIVTLYHIYR